MKKFLLTIFVIIVIVAIAIACVFYFKNSKTSESETDTRANVKKEAIPAETQEVTSKSEYALTDNNLSKFDLSFLKFENEKKNKIYSPLSIKYAFKMLEEGTTGEAQKQLAAIVEGYDITEYLPNKKMAFANALFIRDSYKDSIKESYINALKAKYNADIAYDDFSTAKNINDWVNQHTLGLIAKLFTDDDVQQFNFTLVNALGIDMEWNHKFLEYHYEDDNNISGYVSYEHERLYWGAYEELYKLDFDDNQEVSSMKVIATLNNYDIVKELGEENIKSTVRDAFIDWAKNDILPYYPDHPLFENDFSDEGIEKAFEKYWSAGNDWGEEDTSYLDEIATNYGRVNYTTDFSLYVDNSVKVFAKDLEKSDGTTLQYIGIMPIKQDLNEFIEENTEEDIKNLIGKLKDLKLENFKDGVLTKIKGYIPKFKFDYDLNLQEDLEKLGVTDVFEQGKASLTKITDDESVFIGKVTHKATIEFTENGIKAAAATGAGGLGAGEDFNYYFDIPIEEIDITFDKPYMFIIRDKETGETWFVGTVYEPLSSEDEPGAISEISIYD